MADLECLRQLRRVVEAAPEDRFDMQDFCTETGCGTAYCAAGWAAIDPWFREHTELGRTYICKDGMLDWDDMPATTLARAFGLDSMDVYRLFYDVAEDTGKADVLASIDQLLAGRPAPAYPGTDVT